MPDIFISYKQEERSVAANLAAHLTQEGYDVWWDAALLAGERFEDEISEVLSASRAVIVLWSRKSVHSDWVKAEAESARMQRKVLPAVIDDLPLEGLPLLFRGLHVTPLQDWSGDPAHPGFNELMKAVRERVGGARGPSLTPVQAEAKLAEGISEAEIWAAISASSDPSADEYRAYLKRYGPDARFAELAEIRIARIERRERGDARTPMPPPLSVASAPATAPAKAEPPAIKLAPRPRPFWLRPLPLALLTLVVILIGGGAYMLNSGMMSRVSTLLVPQAVKDAASRCTTWSNSPVLDPATGLPKIDALTAADCDKARAGFPNDPNYLGLVALARVAQGAGFTDDAKSFASRGVDQRSAAANLAMGAMYEHGIVFDKDSRRAANYYRTAADLGLPRGAARLCFVWIDRGALPDATTADDLRRYCKTASDAGDALGQVAEGYVLEAGFDKGVDNAGAAELYRLASDQGSLDGKLALGTLFQRGVGVDRDFNRAMGLFSAAADAGYPEAMRRLAIMYELGQGTDADVDHAAQLYETASIKGDDVALYLASYALADGEVPSNRMDAEMERLADDTTNPVGLRMLGMLYERGYLRTADNNLARQQFQLCAGLGNSMCQFALGNFNHYYDTDDTKAAVQFQLSADQGNLYGQYWLGYLYENGLGVEQDTAKAKSLYRLAANQGHLTAINYLNSLNNQSSAAN
jgi:TPR repeat protein